MPEQSECELCLEFDHHTPANRQLQGVWVCIGCITKINQAEIAQSQGRPRYQKPEEVKFRAGSILDRLEEAAKPVPRQEEAVVAEQGVLTVGSTILTPMTGKLTEALSRTLDGLLNGTLTPETAFAICKVSAETVKAMELVWRMRKD